MILSDHLDTVIFQHKICI